MKLNYKHTIYACFIGYIVQAIVVNFAPLLFLTFQSAYGIPLSKITFLVTINFGLQLVIDFLSAGFVDRIGYRASAVLAHIFAVVGLLALTILPELTADPFTGLLIAVMIYAIGGGLLEVLISPIVEACPTDNKEKAMSLLHSFYSWGQLGVVLLSTLFFTLVGVEHWKIVAVLWAMVPLCNIFLFIKVPIMPLLAEDEKELTRKELLTTRTFWILMLLMVCSGASEQSVAQWASAYAESGLGVSKTIGDLAGPMFFALAMGIARTIYGKYGDRLNLERFMVGSGILCVCSYLLTALSPIPFLGLIGCGICGFSVGVLWPGTLSMASAGIKGGGTLMFALLALGGDLGCSLGPTIVGKVAAAFGDSLNMGILAAIIFPLLLLLGITLCRLDKKSMGSKR